MSGGLWKNHPATPRQTGLFDRPRRARKPHPTQADVLIAMLRAHREQGKPLELPDIMQAGIAQHGARFNEIRSRGFVVVNEIDRSGEGVVRSRYRLTFDPESEVR
jgi:hypothetical protein